MQVKQPAGRVEIYTDTLAKPGRVPRKPHAWVGAVRRIVYRARGSYTATATDWLREMEGECCVLCTRSRYWPKDPANFGWGLAGLVPELQKVGLTVAAGAVEGQWAVWVSDDCIDGTFRSWLLLHTSDDTALGDLSRDAARDSVWDGTLGGLFDRLQFYADAHAGREHVDVDTVQCVWREAVRTWGMIRSRGAGRSSS